MKMTGGRRRLSASRTQVALRWLAPLSLLLRLCPADAANVQVNADGTQRLHEEERPNNVHATFVNLLSSTTSSTSSTSSSTSSSRESGEVNLYWSGYRDHQRGGTVGGPRIYYGPISPNGGERTIDAYPGHVFTLTRAGTYEVLGEYELTEDTRGVKRRYTLTEEDAEEARRTWPPRAEESERREETSEECRSSEAKNCRECVEYVPPTSSSFSNHGGGNGDGGGGGCGWSVVRKSCYRSHPIATINSITECLDEPPPAHTKSVDAWLNRATALTLGQLEEREGGYGLGPRGLRTAYRCLERGVEAAALAEAEAEGDAANAANAPSAAAAAAKAKKAAAASASKRAHAALAELSAKLQAVYDDADARELLSSSRHPSLAAIHPGMPAVPRRTATEARSYVARGEPVVITDAFEYGVDEESSPVSHRWTLEYLNKLVFGSSASTSSSSSATAGDDAPPPPRFNVASDAAARCCRYFEPPSASARHGHPYPFAPTTHLYRDTFDNFVKTVRRAGRTNSTSPRRKLHYLHEIVMNKEGEVVVAGGPAPPQLVRDIESTTSRLTPIASDQPFFGQFASAKVWTGQRDIVMPLHYDATDNLYVMAWGRKKAYVGEPGQLGELYRYPNAHPLAGSSQVNVTSPDLGKYPNFVRARLREVVVGPGDVLYLPAWWWHQFEQPFEDTAALNLWSADAEDAPEASYRDRRVREHALADRLESAAVQAMGSGEAGIVLEALANGGRISASSEDGQRLIKARKALIVAAEEWLNEASSLPGGNGGGIGGGPNFLSTRTKTPEELVAEYLEVTHGGVLSEARETMSEESWDDWKPGTGWDLSQVTVLPRELRDRCREAPESSPFMSLCG